MGRPKGGAKEVGKVLVSVGGWTERHRTWAKEFAATVGRDERPPDPKGLVAGAGPRPPDPKGLVAGAGPRPPDLEERIKRLAAEFAANAPEKEPIACWGGCGKELPNGCRPSAVRRKGNRPRWYSRRVEIMPSYEDLEVYCPDCFEQLGGFHGPAEGMG